MKLLHIFLSLALLIVAVFVITPHSALAVSYDLIAPTNTLTEGQEVQFIVNIDAQGANLTSAQVGMTYESQYLQYENTTPGDAMNSVSATQSGTGTLLIDGSNSSGFTGTGTFAYVTFKLIATAPGSSELCVLFAPSTTPVPTATIAPIPTELPKTGTVENTSLITLIGGVLFISSIASFVILKR